MFLIAEAVVLELEHGGAVSLSLWAVLFVLLLLLIGVYACFRLVVLRERRLWEEQRRSLKEKHEDELDTLKLRLLTGVGQELLTPITMVIGPLQQLASEPLAADVSGRVRMALRNAQSLLHQVNMLPVGMPVSTVGVPMPPVQPVAEKVDAAELTGVDDSNVGDVVELSEDEEMPMNHRFTMLMVDDSVDMCRFVRDYFRGEYNVVTAHNGEEAMKCLDEIDNIDLVVSDVTMPKMDGMELCKYVKSDLRWSHIPVILLTGRTGEEMEVEGLKLGADDYITKPFNAEMLRLRVKKLIETQKNRQKQFREKVDVTAGEITITSVDEEFIQQAMKICEDHISDMDFSVEMLGQELSLSRTYLYKKLINITGKGPAEFIRTIRMKHGRQYLETTSMQITEIATAVGYANPKRFTENFKAEYGMSPSEYVRKFRAERIINS